MNFEYYDYQILVDIDEEELSNKVNSKLKEGYTLIGGVSHDRDYVLQAIALPAKIKVSVSHET